MATVLYIPQIEGPVSWFAGTREQKRNYNADQEPCNFVATLQDKSDNLRAKSTAKSCQLCHGIERRRLKNPVKQNEGGERNSVSSFGDVDCEWWNYTVLLLIMWWLTDVQNFAVASKRNYRRKVPDLIRLYSRLKSISVQDMGSDSWTPWNSLARGINRKYSI